MKNARIKIILISIGILLLIPLIAMQFTQEVSWNIIDFVIMAFLLLVTGLGCELIMRNVTKIKNRAIFCLALLFAFLLVWAELAVGIFGTPFAGS